MLRGCRSHIVVILEAQLALMQSRDWLEIPKNAAGAGESECIFRQQRSLASRELLPHRKQIAKARPRGLRSRTKTKQNRRAGRAKPKRSFGMHSEPYRARGFHGFGIRGQRIDI